MDATASVWLSSSKISPGVRLANSESLVWNQLSALLSELPRITIDPEAMGGKPYMRGTRVTVGMIVEAIANWRTLPELLEDFPYLQKQEVREALAYGQAWLKYTKSA